MHMTNIPFGTTDWESIAKVEHKGERGSAFWRTKQCGAIRVRMVEYTAGYKADHWCHKGHILFCLEGELYTELENGEEYLLRAGMSYEVADETMAHRSYTSSGAKLLIVD